MDFNKIAKDMFDLQEKLNVYQTRNNKIKDLLTQLVKDYTKIEKKFSKEKDEIQKLIIQLELLYTKRMINYIENIYKEASEEIGNQKENLNG